jgi:hypothetical protein
LIPKYVGRLKTEGPAIDMGQGGPMARSTGEVETLRVTGSDLEL